MVAILFFFCRNGISFNYFGQGQVGYSKNDHSMAWNYTANNSLPIPDEFGLFYQCVSNKTSHFKNEKCTEGKHSKVCLTGMARVM